jgi:hypothetical protein
MNRIRKSLQRKMRPRMDKGGKSMHVCPHAQPELLSQEDLATTEGSADSGVAGTKAQKRKTTAMIEGIPTAAGQNSPARPIGPTQNHPPGRALFPRPAARARRNSGPVNRREMMMTRMRCHLHMVQRFLKACRDVFGCRNNASEVLAAGLRCAFGG